MTISFKKETYDFEEYLSSLPIYFLSALESLERWEENRMDKKGYSAIWRSLGQEDSLS